jgi:phenylacetate-CoA ligase
MSEEYMGETIYYNPKCETMPREDIEQQQIERLQSTLNRAYRNVAFYQKAFDVNRVNLENIKDLGTLSELPFTTKEDLQKSYPYDMFAVPLRNIVRIHSTSGIAGKPIVVGFTRDDLRNWTECTARLLAAAGLTEHDVVQIALDYNLFTSGFGFQQGAEQIGASVIPASFTASVEKQIVIMRDFKTTALVTTPSHAVNIAAGLEEFGVHTESLHLRHGLFSGERWSDQLRKQLEKRLHITSTDAYGLTEIMNPGVAGECHLREGLHINEDHFIVEIINPKTLEPVGIGPEGELVLTTITKEGFPLIRYRTGDITSLNPEPCACGRTFLRMARVLSRTDDLISFRGVEFFPSQIEQILRDVEGISSNYQLILGREAGVDTLEIKVEISDTIPFLDGLKSVENMLAQLSKRIKTILDVDAKITLVEPKSLRHIDDKSRVVDKRPG